MAFVVGLLATAFAVWLGFAEAIDPLLATALAGAAALTTLIGGSVAARLYYRRQDMTGKHWLWFWEGPLGYWTATLAGLGVKGRRRHRLPSAQRAESAIFEGARRIFEQLPNAAQSALERLPDVLAQLELQTVGLRTWVTELDADLARADPPAASRDLHEKVQHRLSEAVTAVENVRLELERLRDGAASVRAVTGELSAAQDVTEAVGRLLDQRKRRGA